MQLVLRKSGVKISSNLHDANAQKHPIPYSTPSLPARIQDALHVCQQLGISYPWVDSLCIAQNQGQEKQNAIAEVGHIYRGCYICSAAAADGGVHDALPGVRHVTRHQPRLQVENLTLGICPPPLRETVHQSKWNSRGWVFQESTLSFKTLVVLNDQAFLQTNRSIRCESVDVDIGKDTTILSKTIKKNR